MFVQMVIMLSTLLILPLIAGALTLEHIRHDRRTPSRVRRPTLSVHE
jgi:hypothetical protein